MNKIIPVDDSLISYAQQKAAEGQSTNTSAVKCAAAGSTVKQAGSSKKK